MYSIVTQQDFFDAFAAVERESQFSNAALHALYSYFVELEEDTGEQIELDQVAICCDWAEYNDLAAIQADYPHIITLDDLQEYTTVIRTDDDTIVIQQF